MEKNVSACFCWSMLIVATICIGVCMETVAVFAVVFIFITKLSEKLDEIYLENTKESRFNCNITERICRIQFLYIFFISILCIEWNFIIGVVYLIGILLHLGKKLCKEVGMAREKHQRWQCVQRIKWLSKMKRFCIEEKIVNQDEMTLCKEIIESIEKGYKSDCSDVDKELKEYVKNKKYLSNLSENDEILKFKISKLEEISRKIFWGICENVFEEVGEELFEQEFEQILEVFENEEKPFVYCYTKKQVEYIFLMSILYSLFLIIVIAV